MADWLGHWGFGDVLTAGRLLAVLRALVALAVGLVVARVISASVSRALSTRLSRQQTMLVRRFLYYGMVVIVITTALHELGFQLGVLLGAAGILTVALGFASQTSASNLISGLFLIVERPFVVGDVVRIDDVTGEVLSVDLLSVKLRTFDNLFVRIPNETIIKSRMTTLTTFPLRRVDVKIGVAYKEDLDHVKDVLMRLSERNPLSLEEPAPLFIFSAFGDSALELQFSVWGMRENYLNLKNSIQQDIKREFDKEGIEIPYPQRTLTAGPSAASFPVQVVSPGPAGDPSRG